MENIIWRQSSSLGGEISPLTELMPTDSLEYNTMNSKTLNSHCIIAPMDVTPYNLTEDNLVVSPTNATAALPMNLVHWRGAVSFNRQSRAIFYML